MIDDDVTMCDYVNRVTTKNGYKFQNQNRASEALKNIKKVEPDLIILDLHLPDGDGLQLSKQINQDAVTQHIPVFILTTREFYIERDIAFKTGASAFIKKPFNVNELLQEIEDLLADQIEITIWGARGSTPCANREHMYYGGNTSCVQIDIPGNKNFLILDSGSGIRNLGDEILDNNDEVKGRIFITHPHWDHIQGFPFFKPIYIPENKFSVHMPNQLAGGCKEVLAGQMTYTYFPVTTEMLQADITYVTQQPSEFNYEGYSVEYLLSNHPITTAIYKVRIGSNTIIYCPDNEIVPGKNKESNAFYRHLLEFIEGADILMHDGQFNRDIYQTKQNWGHSAWEDAVELGEEAGVDKLFIMHHDPASNDDYLQNVEKQMQDSFGHHFDTLDMAKESSTIRLTHHATKN